MTDETLNLPADSDDTPIQDTEAYQAGVRAAQERLSAITQAYAPFPGAAQLRERAISEDWDVDRARSELLAHLGRQASPTPRRGSPDEPRPVGRPSGLGNGLRITPFTQLARVHAISAIGDGLITVALAGSIFFSIDPDAARWRDEMS